MKLVKRTFEARQHGEGTPERVRLNRDWQTSEYMPSYRYGVVLSNGRDYWTFRTKREAEAALKTLVP